MYANVSGCSFRGVVWMLLDAFIFDFMKKVWKDRDDGHLKDPGGRRFAASTMTCTSRPERPMSARSDAESSLMMSRSTSFSLKACGKKIKLVVDLQSYMAPPQASKSSLDQPLTSDGLHGTSVPGVHVLIG
jgi:hypothetical protein